MVVSSRSLRIHVSMLSSLTNDFIGTQGRVVNPLPVFPWHVPVPRKEIIYPPIDIKIQPFPLIPNPPDGSDSDSDEKKSKEKKKVQFPVDPVDVEVYIPPRNGFSRCISFIRLCCIMQPFRTY